MDRDLRETPLYKEVESYFRALHDPGTDAVTDAADVTVHPDGRLAAITGTVFNDLASAPVTRLCLVDLVTADLRQVQKSAGSERLPRWSPDGTQLAYLSDRNGAGPQLFLTDPEGSGEARETPAVDGMVEYLQWSPDGRMVLLGVAGYGADLAGCQGGGTTIAKTDDLPEWLPVIETGDAENLWRRLHVFDTETGTTRVVSRDGLNCWEACWLGDDWFAAVVSDSHSEGAWYTARLAIIDIATGAEKTLYEPKDQIGVPAASPTGDRLAVLEAVCSDRMIVAGDVLIIDPATGSRTTVDTAGTDVTHVMWRDEDRLVYAGHRGYETVVGDLDVHTGGIIEHWSGIDRTIGSWYPAIWPLPGGGCAGVGEAYEVAPELAILREGEYSAVVSTATDASASPEFNNATVEPFTWTARDGLEMQGWLVRPGGDGPYPLVMDIHGGPVWACRNRWQGRLRGTKVLTDHGQAVFYPNPRGSSCRGQDFARLVVGDMGGEDTYDYLTGIDALVKRGIADPQRLGVTGISYGGFMSSWLITQDTLFAAAVPISPVTNWYSQHRTSQIPFFDELFLDGSAYEPGGKFFDRSPAMFASRVKTPTLQLAGALDQNTPPTQALEFHRALLENGVESVLATYPTGVHGIRTYPEVIDHTTRYVGWFLERLGGER